MEVTEGQVMLVVVAAVGMLLVAVGFGLWWLPLGLIVGGGELLAGAYAAAYMRAKGGTR